MIWHIYIPWDKWSIIACRICLHESGGGDNSAWGASDV